MNETAARRLAELLGLNEEQFRAAADCEHDVLVSAGAGTGKTRVLVARYVFLLLLGGYRPAQIATITFTNKAAREMRERIGGALVALGEEFPTAAAALAELDLAPIQTIHAFCLRLIREEPLSGGVVPGSDVLEEGAAKILLGAACEDALATALNRLPAMEGLDELLSCFGRRRLLNLLAEVHEAARVKGIDLAAVGAEEAGENPAQVGEELLRFWDALTGLPAEELPAGTKKALALLVRRKDDLAALVRRGEEDPLFLKELESLLGSLRAPACRGLVEEGKLLLGRLRRSLAMAKAARIGPVFCALLRLAGEAYEAEKRRRGAVDFADLEIFARKLLKQEDVRHRLRARYPVLLIDEFQDTNPLQWAIVEAFWQGPDGARLFVVGDVKQSIYRFRGAAVHLMHELRRELEAGGGHVYTLQENYRCLPPLASFVNHVAGRLLGEEMVYEPLLPRRNAPEAGPRVEVLLVPGEELDRESEAALIVERIFRLCGGEEKIVVDGAEPRPPRPGEMALLFRAATDIDLYEKALHRAGIPTRNLVGKGLFSSSEVADLLALLAVVEKATDGVALAAALRSPLFGVSDAGLYLLARENGLVHGFFTVDPLPAELGEDAPRLAKAREIIGRLRQKKHLLRLDDLLAEAMTATEARSLQAVFPDYRQRLANLERLLELARDYARLGRGEIGEFLAYIKAMERLEVGEGEAPTAGGEEAVTLLTVHRAKGLEFPVVFLPDLGRTLNPRGAAVLVAEDGRLGFRFGAKNDGLATPLWDELDGRAAREEEAEAKRLLYVAMTRARDYLILVGSGTSRGGNWLSWLKETVPLPAESARIVYPGGEAVVRFCVPGTLPALSRSPLAGRYPAVRKGESLGVLPGSTPGGPPGFRPRPEMPVVTVSGWLAFRSCPRRFYLRYLLQVPEWRPNPAEEEPEIKGALLGIIVHARAAAMARAGDGETHVGSEEVTNLLANYRRSESFVALATARRVFTEYGLALTFPSGVISGIADLVWLDKEGRPCLADLKTHRLGDRPEEWLLTLHALQVRGYALALRRLFGRPVARVRLEYLRPGYGVEVPCEDASLDELEGELGEFLRFLAGSPGFGAFVARPRIPCRWCGYHGISCGAEEGE
ncbi:MAG: UvrD-helicase domain-containing protein [Firmicutes bacterium]|nr:UvrD-helicase domain-containing protein [Bacillota bacterium]